MSDQAFHEIQLSGKQLIFLFMCAVVLAAVIFLFGVSVGRNVRTPGTESAPTMVADATGPAEATPPPTETAPNELSYAEALQGKGTAAGTSAPPTEAPPVPPTGPPEAESAPEAKPAKPAAPAAAPKPHAETPAAKPAPATTAAASGGYSLQVGAFNTSGAAGNLVAALKRKGYPAYLETLGPSTPVRFRVHVGPYGSRSESQQILSRLKKAGYNPLLKH